MNKTPRLSKSGIEYMNYSWGIYSGCHNYLLGICDGGGIKDGKGFNCWARSIANRFPNHYPNGFEPTYYPEAINSPMRLKKPSIIGVGWVGDVIGYGLAYREEIFDTIYNCPQHTFLFLTKNADQLIKWGKFPENAWVGMTATDFSSLYYAVPYIAEIEAKVKYISFEPLLESMMSDSLELITPYLQWVIIGSQTKPYKPPKIEWVEEIVRACDKAGVKAFLKYNLVGYLPIEPPFYKQDTEGWAIRQELPK